MARVCSGPSCWQDAQCTDAEMLDLRPAFPCIPVGLFKVFPKRLGLGFSPGNRERAGLDWWHADLSWGPALDGWRAELSWGPGPDTERRQGDLRPDAESAGPGTKSARPRHREHQASTEGAPGPDRESAGPQHRETPRPHKESLCVGRALGSESALNKERRAPTRRPPGPDTESAGAGHRERWDPTQKSAGSAAAPGNDTENRESAGHRECRAPTAGA